MNRQCKAGADICTLCMRERERGRKSTPRLRPGIHAEYIFIRLHQRAHNGNTLCAMERWGLERAHSLSDGENQQKFYSCSIDCLRVALLIYILDENGFSWHISNGWQWQTICLATHRTNVHSFICMCVAFVSVTRFKWHHPAFHSMLCVHVQPSTIDH